MAYTAMSATEPEFDTPQKVERPVAAVGDGDGCGHDGPLTIRTRLCVGLFAVPVDVVHGDMQFTKLAVKERDGMWLREAIDWTRGAKLQELATYIKIKAAVLAARSGKHSRLVWKRDLKGDAIAEHITVHVDGQALDVSSSVAPLRIAIDAAQINWVIAKLCLDMAGLPGGVAEPCSIVQAMVPSSDEDVSGGDDDDMYAARPPTTKKLCVDADELVALNEHGIRVHPSRSEFVVKRCLAHTLHKVPRRFRMRPRQMEIDPTAEKEFQLRRATVFLETGVLAPA
jgi:hypothetical protein